MEGELGRVLTMVQKTHGQGGDWQRLALVSRWRVGLPSGRTSGRSGGRCFQAAQQAQQAVEDRQRMRRPAGDEEVNGQERRAAIMDLGVTAIERSADLIAPRL